MWRCSKRSGTLLHSLNKRGNKSVYSLGIEQRSEKLYFTEYIEFISAAGSLTSPRLYKLTLPET